MQAIAQVVAAGAIGARAGPGNRADAADGGAFSRALCRDRKQAWPSCIVTFRRARGTTSGNTSVRPRQHCYWRSLGGFCAAENLGLIVVDEEHESSYKQEETPHYHARDVAVMRGHLERVPVVLGSATPSLESFHHAQQGKYRLAELRRRVEDGELPTVHVLDLRTTARRVPGAPPPRPCSWRTIVEAIQARLDRHEQSIIFLNRRGYASSLQCPQCGMSRCARTAASRPRTTARPGG